MNHVEIRIGEISTKNPLFPEVAGIPLVEASTVGIGVLKGGMKSGRCSVAFVAKVKGLDGNESLLVLEFSGANIVCLGNIVEGIERSQRGETCLQN